MQGNSNRLPIVVGVQLNRMKIEVEIIVIASMLMIIKQIVIEKDLELLRSKIFIMKINEGEKIQNKMNKLR